VAVDAAWRVGEVIFALGVTAQARGALGSRRRFPVSGVTALALLVLRFRVQARKRRFLMAARARRRPRNPLRTVGAVTALAARYALPVRGFRLCRVAAGAAHLCGRPAVGLMAFDALFVSGGCALVLGRVTALARSGECAPVRLVAARALRMSRLDLAALARVARIAADRQRLGPVR